MAQLVQIESNRICILLACFEATKAARGAPKVHALLLAEYLRCTEVLSNCWSIFSKFREDTILDHVSEASGRCAILACGLISVEGTTGAWTEQPSRLTIGDWDKIKIRYKELRESVRYLHDLAQR
jgi:hypothetical protein